MIDCVLLTYVMYVRLTHNKDHLLTYLAEISVEDCYVQPRAQFDAGYRQRLALTFDRSVYPARMTHVLHARIQDAECGKRFKSVR